MIEPPKFTHHKVFHCFLLFTIGLVAYYSSLSYDFILGLDDDWLLMYNPAIKDLSLNGLKFLLFEDTRDLHYYPLTYISLAIDYHFFGMNAGMMRLHNIILHALNGIWVYLIFSKIINKKGIAFLTAVIFIVHPLQIESVAWVICRRQVLFLFYFFAAWYVYLLKLEVSPQQKQKRYLFHVVAVVLFSLSLLSKATGIFLPAILFSTRLLYDRVTSFNDIKWKQIFLEYAPFVIVACISLYLNNLSDSRNFLKRDFDYTPFQHFIFILYSIGFYAVRTILPGKQCVFYPSPEEGISILPAEYYLFALAGLFMIFVFYLLIKRKSYLGAFLVAGYFFSIAILTNRILLFSDLPSIVADRYYYQSAPFLIALFLLALQKIEISPLKLLVYACYLIFISIQFCHYLPAWSNVTTLFDRIVIHHPNKEFILRSGMAEYRYGNINKARERLELAKTTTDRTYINNPYWFYDEEIQAYIGIGDTLAVDSIYQFLSLNRPDILSKLKALDSNHSERINVVLGK